jgi:NAD-dependent deacetylase
VYPAAGLIDAARARGALTIEINPQETRYSADVDHSLRGPAGEILPLLFGTEPS